MKQEEFLEYHVSQITTLNELLGKFRLYFPNLQFSYDLIPSRHLNETLKIKEVEGLGTYLYYSRQGKRAFHELLLDYITEELRKQEIKYRRSRKNIGEDLTVKNFKIELEVRSDPSKKPETRPNLIQRIRQHPDTTILILLNKKDKEAYLHSIAREIIISNNRFLTIPEFLTKIGKL